jgi:hypothetical protein
MLNNLTSLSATIVLRHHEMTTDRRDLSVLEATAATKTIEEGTGAMTGHHIMTMIDLVLHMIDGTGNRLGMVVEVRNEDDMT